MKTFPLWKIWLPVASVIVALGLLELVFRILPAPEIAPTARAGFAVPDPDLIWRLAPHDSGTLATNELGHRDGPYNDQADVKVLLLGDSVSWGDGVTKGQAYPYRLQLMLNEIDPTTTYEIINSAVPGYSTFQQLRYLELYGLDLEPDAIVLQFCLNDVVERYTVLAEYGGGNVFLGVDTRDAAAGAHGFLLRHSRFYERLTRSLVDVARRREEYRVRNLSSESLSPDLEAAWELALSELKAIRDVAALHEIPLLVVIAPYEYQLHDPEATAQPQRRLAAFAQSHDIAVLDLLPIFAANHQGSDHSVLFRDRNHFSWDGHKLTAETLIEPVSRLVGHGGGSESGQTSAER